MSRLEILKAYKIGKVASIRLEAALIFGILNLGREANNASNGSQLHLGTAPVNFDFGDWRLSHVSATRPAISLSLARSQNGLYET